MKRKFIDEQEENIEEQFSFDDFCIPEEVEEKEAVEESEEKIELKKGFVIRGNLNLREAPSKETKVVQVLPVGTELVVEEIGIGWLKVSVLRGVEGWVMSEFVEVEE